MIQDKRSIEIKSSREEIFSLIEKMPNKFPVLLTKKVLRNLKKWVEGAASS